MQKLSKEKIFYIWLLLQPIIDLIVSLTIRNSDSSITIGIILRGLFLLTLLLVTIFSKKILFSRRLARPSNYMPITFKFNKSILIY